MSDQRLFPSRSNANRDLGERLRTVRVILYGEYGTPELARALRLSCARGRTTKTASRCPGRSCSPYSI